jgi:hypothetical protein
MFPKLNPERSNTMKRLIVAASLAALTGSAFAVEIGKPFEQLDLDRALPNIAQPEAAATVYPFAGSAPYEQLAIDRALPDIDVPAERVQVAASAGETLTDATADVVEAKPAVSPFAHQHDFIAPAP